MADTKTPDAPPAYEAAAAAKPVPLPRGPRPLDLPVLNKLRSKRVVLASASPRRKQLLAQIGLPGVECVPSAFPEDIPKTGLSPFEYVLQTATAKALASYQAQLGHPTKGDPELIIAADTVVVGHGGRILEKPRSEREHVEMLKSLRDTGAGGVSGVGTGREHDALVGGGIRGEGAVGLTGLGVGKDGKAKGGWHRVFTAVAVLAPLESARDPGYALETIVEETGVQFDGSVSDELLLAYVRTREGADKAGGYGIQGIGTLLVERIDGSWDNVVGLPLRATIRLIEKVVDMAENEDLLENGEEEEDD